MAAMRRISGFVASVLLVGLVACGGGGGTTSPPPGSLSVSVTPGTALIYPGQSATQVNVTITRQGATGSVTLSVQGLPSGITANIQSPNSSNSGSITFSASATAAAASLPLTVTASDGSVSGSTPFALSVGAIAQISTIKNGRFEVAMSTSFQPAEWDDQFFTLNPGATTTLGNLLPQHVRLQGISQGVPQKTASTWDFAMLDAITQPVLGVGDNSPEFQIAVAPAFMYDANHNFVDPTFQTFAVYAQNLVQYYNTGGFTAGDGFHKSPSNHPVQWWGIYNEPSINNVNANQYTLMYNTLVPAMQSVDPSLKFVAIELCCSSETSFLPVFASGANAQVDVVASHYYSTCNQKDTDTQLLSTIPSFVTSVNYMYSQLKSAANPALNDVPVWVTENNVNADFDKGNGISNCNGGTFVTDLRGSSPFFAAWRPYVFSQLGKAGVKALYHWDFGADKQYGEVDYQTGAYQLSYWVDYWLARRFAFPPGADLLQFTTTDASGIEILPVLNADGSVTVMVSNFAVRAAGDNNGPGAPRTVQIDTSAFGGFSTASLLTIGATTNVASGPAAVSITPASQIAVTLSGYGVAFLTLTP